MIDGHFLPEGKRLMEIANKLNEKAAPLVPGFDTTFRTVLL
jgi:hypothetical protein